MNVHWLYGWFKLVCDYVWSVLFYQPAGPATVNTLVYLIWRLCLRLFTSVFDVWPALCCFSLLSERLFFSSWLPQCIGVFIRLHWRRSDAGMRNPSITSTPLSSLSSIVYLPPFLPLSCTALVRSLECLSQLVFSDKHPVFHRKLRQVRSCLLLVSFWHGRGILLEINKEVLHSGEETGCDFYFSFSLILSITLYLYFSRIHVVSLATRQCKHEDLSASASSLWGKTFIAHQCVYLIFQLQAASHVYALSKKEMQAISAGNLCITIWVQSMLSIPIKPYCVQTHLHMHSRNNSDLMCKNKYTSQQQTWSIIQ